MILKIKVYHLSLQLKNYSKRNKASSVFWFLLIFFNLKKDHVFGLLIFKDSTNFKKFEQGID